MTDTPPRNSFKLVGQLDVLGSSPRRGAEFSLLLWLVLASCVSTTLQHPSGPFPSSFLWGRFMCVSLAFSGAKWLLHSFSFSILILTQTGKRRQIYAS